MGKKKSRAKYTSKGQRRSMDTRPLKAVRRERHPLRNLLNKIDSFVDGKKVYLTIPNPNPKETNKPYIRVRAEDESHARKKPPILNAAG